MPAPAGTVVVLSLPVEHVDVIARALQDLPYRLVAPILIEIEKQARPQIHPPPPAEVT